MRAASSPREDESADGAQGSDEEKSKSDVSGYSSARGRDKPSDHVPVVTELNFEAD